MHLRSVLDFDWFAAVIPSASLFVAKDAVPSVLLLHVHGFCVRLRSDRGRVEQTSGAVSTVRESLQMMPMRTSYIPLIVLAMAGGLFAETP